MFTKYNYKLHITSLTNIIKMSPTVASEIAKELYGIGLGYNEYILYNGFDEVEHLFENKIEAMKAVHYGNVKNLKDCMYVDELGHLYSISEDELEIHTESIAENIAEDFAYNIEEMSKKLTAMVDMQLNEYYSN